MFGQKGRSYKSAKINIYGCRKPLNSIYIAFENQYRFTLKKSSYTFYQKY